MIPLNIASRKFFLTGFFVFLGATLSFAVALADAGSGAGGVALVYKGSGACDSCSTAAAQMARLAGFTPKFVGPQESDEKIFSGAQVWIQPGGRSLDVAKNMNPNLKGMILNFLQNGGGYVGFCAGAFFATAEIRDEGVAGLGIFPGRSWLWLGVPDAPAILEIKWGNSQREMYWEGGPYLDLSQVDLAKVSVEQIANYGDGKLAAAKTTYGKGRVYITGVHPEAPEDWRTYAQLKDRDGVDWALAVDMIKWSGHQIQ